jgi:hypothetical protein
MMQQVKDKHKEIQALGSFRFKSLPPELMSNLFNDPKQNA